MVKPKKKASRAAAKGKKSPAKRKHDEDVIEIDLIPSSVATSFFGNARKRSRNGDKKPSAAIHTEDIIILSSDDDSDDGSIDLTNLKDDKDDDDSEVMVVDKNDGTEYFDGAGGADADIDGDDEVQAIGEKNVMRLPHMRQHCTDCKFVEDVRYFSKNSWGTNAKKQLEEGKICNHKTCEKCYCFICDKPVSECKNWASDTFNPDDHCHASDKGQGATYYRNQRDLAKRGMLNTTAGSSGSSSADFDLHRANRDFQEAVRRLMASSGVSNTRYMNEDGPFEPDYEQATLDPHTTQCRKCGWWNKFKHKNYTRYITSSGQRFATNFHDWCHACGRVASERDFEKTKSQPYEPQEGEIELGTKKTISFTIRPHDPRKMNQFKQRWEKYGDKSPAWTYSVEDMEEDFFRHRIGKHPKINMLLNSIPITPNDDIPDDGRYRGYGCSNYGYNDSSDLSVNECEALLLDNAGDITLLKTLQDILEKDRGCGVIRTLEAKWDRTKRKGTIEITLFFRRNCLVNGLSVLGSTTRPKFSILLGLWFNVFPFKLSDLTGGLQVEPLPGERKKRMFESGHILSLNKKLTASESKRLLKDFKDDDIVTVYNGEANGVQSKLSFQSSAKVAGCGGTTGNDTSFGGTIKRLMTETLVDDSLTNYGSFNIANTVIADKLGLVSDHRNLRKSNSDSLDCRSNAFYNSYTAYLEKKDVSLMQNLHQTFESINERCTTMNGLLQQLENLGHTPVEHVDGLKVELFDFQREAVGWALERERASGGLESFLWTKVPCQCMQVTNTGKRREPVDLYFSPILECFKTEKPSEVRGGLIAAQMGLGKTVISLSLVLMNPAPTLPESGSLTADMPLPVPGNQANGETYTPVWPAIGPKPPETSTKHGKFLSRGTLVVCNVSLVGQWVDEAKSKLKDPGLVYSYYGGKRTRNSKILAQNAIVVTTYNILASDYFHHRGKSNDPDYCAPLEGVRWWRIICDESHSIRDKNTRTFKALGRLSAVNKWCVTGTPMNTTPNDLKGQLTFIGLDHVDKMFAMFSNNMSSVFNTSTRNRRYASGIKAIGPFLYLMRNVMIRHSIAQTGRTSNTSIMALPPKEENVIEIEFTKEERKEYTKIEEKAIALYESLKSRGSVNKHYLRLTSALLPLRLSCSGGRLDEGQVKRNASSSSSARKSTRQGPGIELDITDDQECAICLDHIECPRATRCKPVPHVFCKECIQGVFNGEETIPCPCCRTPIKQSELQEVIPKESNEDVKPMGAKVAKRKSPKRRALSDSDILFRSKFERLLRELKLIRDKEPESKSLVFSQFTSTLQWMQQELPKHGFQFRTLSGDMPMQKRAKALREFQSDPPTTIFLLSLRSGAVGINLTQANRVFLMEPAMNPALEAQAVGRVYRLGQRKEVKIIRMRIKDSFESRLVKVHKKKFGEATKPAPSEDRNKDAKGSDGSKGTNDKSCEEKGVKEPMASTSTVSFGHMTRDKASLLIEEFDELFGVSKSNDTGDVDPLDM